MCISQKAVFHVSYQVGEFILHTTYDSYMLIATAFVLRLFLGVGCLLTIIPRYYNYILRVTVFSLAGRQYSSC